MIRFTIPGQPQGKGRPRVTTQGGRAHAYTPARTAEYERLVRECYPGGMAEGAVQLAIRATYAVPKSWRVADKQKALAGLMPVMVKPDLDNVVKIVMDALNGLAWEDDKQVIWIQAQKQYGAVPGVDVEIWQA